MNEVGSIAVPSTMPRARRLMPLLTLAIASATTAPATAAGLALSPVATSGAPSAPGAADGFSRASITALQATAIAAATTGGTPLMPVDEIRAGMIGVGQTVMQGSELSSFGVEILGVLRDVYPHQHLIIARLTGLGLERSGVIAGMSGSPVTVDGRLVGAVAYRLTNFGHEAIAGIVPIENMLAVADRERTRDHEPGSAVGARSVDVSALLTAAAAYVTGDGVETANLGSLRLPFASSAIADAGTGIEPIATPVTVSGFHPALVERIAPLFAQLGWMPSLGGVAGNSAESDTGGQIGSPGAEGDWAVEPGGSVAVQLVRGDINVAATGTVTYRDGDRILAFGHPFLQGGSVDFPIVQAEVITVLSSMASSSKLAAAGDRVLGSIRQDRLAAVMGVLGTRPPMIPVSLDLTVAGEAAEGVDFEIVADKMLTPLYLFLGLVNGVQGVGQSYGDTTVDLEVRIDLGDGLPTLSFGNLFSSPNLAVIGLSSSLATLFGFLYDNELADVRVRGIDADLSLRDDRRTATLARVWHDTTEVAPGDTFEIAVALQPYRSPEVVERLTVRIPAEAQPGPVDVLVGDGAAVARDEDSFLQGRQRIGDLRNVDQLVRLLNGVRRNDRVYVQLSRPDAGAVLNGELMPSLPPSMRRLLASRRTAGRALLVTRSVLVEEHLVVPYVVTGLHRFRVDVVRPPGS